MSAARVRGAMAAGLALLQVTVLLTPAAPAAAQATYRCEREGRVLFSDRPCETEARPIGVRATPWVQPAHWRLMSATCRHRAEQLQRQSAAAAQDEAAGESLANERELYDVQCGEEESLARQRLLDSARDERERRQMLADEQQHRLALCAEMRRIVELRRPRVSSMPTGERADFERFEANFRQRCLNVTAR